MVAKRRATELSIHGEGYLWILQVSVINSATARARIAAELALATRSATSSVPTSSNSDPPSTFHRFPELSNEIQMEIWSDAIGDIDLHLGPLGLHSLLDDQSIMYCRFQRSEKASYTMQMNLLATCRMSRLIVLETWRRVIAAVPEDEDIYSWKISSCTGWIVATPNRAHRRTLYVETKTNVLRIADEKIEELRRRMNG